MTVTYEGSLLLPVPRLKNQNNLKNDMLMHIKVLLRQEQVCPQIIEMNKQLKYEVSQWHRTEENNTKE